MAVVTMLHPASDRVQRASRDAFERVWQHEGWVLIKESRQIAPPVQADEYVDAIKKAAVAPNAFATQPGPRDPKAAWVEWAVHNGADRPEAESMTKKDLIAAFGE